MRRAAALFLVPLLHSGCFSVHSEFDKADVSALVAERVSESHAALAKTAKAEELLKGSPLTLDNAVVAALALNPDTRVAWADVESAQADLMRATTPQNPVLEAELRFAAGGIGDGTLLTLIDSLVSFLKTNSAKKSADRAFASEQSKAAGKIFSTLFSVKRSYGELFYGRKAEALVTKQADAARSVATIAKEQHKSGGTPALELAKASFHSGEAEETLWQEQINTKKAVLAFAKSLGAGELPAPLTLSAKVPTFNDPLPDEKRMIEVALETRLDLLSGRQRIEALGEKLGVATEYALVPTLDLGVQAAGVAPSTIRVGPKIVYEFPVSLSLALLLAKLSLMNSPSIVPVLICTIRIMTR